MNDAPTNATRREIAVEIPADVVARETELVLECYRKLARLPGFRRGRVPSSILRQRFAEDIKTEVVEALVPRYFREEAERQGLRPVSPPRVTDLHFHEGEPLRFKAAFEVMPEIEVEGYQELRPEPPAVTVTDDEVNQALEQLRQQHATYTAIAEDRPLNDGDYAQVELHGAPRESSATDAKPVHLEAVLVEVGGANTVKEFSENLRGARVGEAKTFDVTYPQDFNDQRLAGQTFTYTLNVKGNQTKHLPELTDEFARALSQEMQSADDLRRRVREQLVAERRHEAEQGAKEKILDGLVARHDFPVPDSLVEHQIDLRLERGLRALAAQGMRTEDMRKMDFDRLRAGQREQALREVKTSLILEKIAERESIRVSDEELDKEIGAVALQSRQPVESVRARLAKDGALERIRHRLRNEKTLDLLYRGSA